MNNNEMLKMCEELSAISKTSNTNMSFSEFLNWICSRIHTVYCENENIDFLHLFRKYITVIENAENEGILFVFGETK